MISKFTIQKINDEARVEDVVGEFVTLKKRGSNLLGLCPFHNEKTPSFNVNPARNIYKCFGCGKAGGPIQFLIDYQQLTYPDALRYLAKKYNIEIEEDAVTDEERQRETEKHNLVESIHIANAYAQKFYTDYMLHKEEGRIGLAYFKERGFINSTIEKFKLGFAPDGFDTFTKSALKEGYQLEVLKKAGLTSSKESSTLDFFRNRVMFPIHNMTGKVVGFGGRIMVKDEKAPKYVNTPESDVYQKSKILYGAYFAKSEISKLDECLLVEGYMDVVSLHQASVVNTVASSGTALTLEQIQIIKKITKNVTIIYDGDDAGISAALKGSTLMLEQDMNVRIVFLPDKEDPDSYVKKYGAETLRDFIRTSRKDIISFFLGYIEGGVKSDMALKVEMEYMLADVLCSIKDPNKRSNYIRECSQRLDVDERGLIVEINKRIGRSKKALSETLKENSSEQTQEKQPDATFEVESIVHREQLFSQNKSLNILERDVVRILLEFGIWEVPVEDNPITVAAYVLDELEGIDLETPAYKALYDVFKTEFGRGNVPDDKFFTNGDNEALSKTAIEILTQPYSLSENWWSKYKIVVPEKKHIFVKDIQSAILRLKQYRNIGELKKVEKLIKETTDDAELMKLMKLHKLLMEQKKEFARTVGNVVYRPIT